MLSSRGLCAGVNIPNVMALQKKEDEHFLRTRQQPTLSTVADCTEPGPRARAPPSARESRDPRAEGHCRATTPAWPRVHRRRSPHQQRDCWAAMPGEVQHQHQHQHQTWHGDMVKAQERIHALHRGVGAFKSYNALLVWPQSLASISWGLLCPCAWTHFCVWNSFGNPALLYALSCVHFQICIVLFVIGWRVLLSLEGSTLVYV
jgi:hypothetical protein